ncbi:MAG TPA: YchJ family metal-binding protein [Nocardioides sp.]|nr:YchJ family metal-binding protein [Nocardioides sp.]
MLSGCPCGSGTAYDACCGPLHRGAREAATAEELMRSRYAAYALGEVDYVFRTWHPRTRPADLDKLDLHSGQWTGLEIHDSGEDWVDFTASYQGSVTGEMRERSRFERRRGRWVYVDGDVT